MQKLLLLCVTIHKKILEKDVNVANTGPTPKISHEELKVVETSLQYFDPGASVMDLLLFRRLRSEAARRKCLCGVGLAKRRRATSPLVKLVVGEGDRRPYSPQECSLKIGVEPRQIAPSPVLCSKLRPASNYPLAAMHFVELDPILLSIRRDKQLL
ncbi:hypothetical protein TNCV_827511 [Trichonephila clavipes]|nr:hypothetical protein TNCV_827511 [Trichonephila clavipes]